MFVTETTYKQKHATMLLNSLNSIAKRNAHSACRGFMYEGEKIYFYPTIYGTDTEFNYMRRIKTGTYGYVNHDFTRA